MFFPQKIQHLKYLPALSCKKTGLECPFPPVSPGLEMAGGYVNGTAILNDKRMLVVELSTQPKNLTAGFAGTEYQGYVALCYTLQCTGSRSPTVAVVIQQGAVQIAEYQ